MLNFGGDALAVFRNAVPGARGTPVYDETGQQEIGTVARVSVDTDSSGAPQLIVSIKMQEPMWFGASVVAER